MIRQYITLVYNTAGEDASALTDDPRVVAMSWSHAIRDRRDREATIERLQAIVTQLEARHRSECDERTRMRAGFEAELERVTEGFDSEIVQATAENERLQAKLATARETNQRLNRRCQAAEAMETEYRHASNAMRQEAMVIADRAAASRWWLDSLRRVVKKAEAREKI